VGKGENRKGKEAERTAQMALWGGYGGFVVGTALIPFAPAVGGIIFWLGVLAVFWAGWLSTKK
jgi:hypothetical protein